MNQSANKKKKGGAAEPAHNRGAPRTPGRPRSETKRQEILDAAIKLFTAHGFDGTSVDDIANVAGVSKQTVYTHFGNKEKLFGVSVSTKCKESGIDSSVIDFEEEPQIMLPEISRRFVALITSPEAVRVYALCTGSAESHPRLGQLFYEHGPKQTVDVLAEYLTTQHKLGRLKVPDAKQSAWQLLSMLKADGHMRAQFKLPLLSENEQQAYIDSCVASFLRAHAV